MKNTRKFYGDTIIKLENMEEEDVSNQFKIEYYQVENAITEASHLVKYGVEILKRDVVSNNILERKEIRNITNVEEKIYNVLDILYRNEVTPVSVEDVIEDLQFMGFIGNRVK